MNYRTFENIVKKRIEELEEPALKLLKDVTGKGQCFKFQCPLFDFPLNIYVC